MTGPTQPAREECFWQRVDGPRCYYGELSEYWCYYCCSGGSCTVQYCEWYIVGSCLATDASPQDNAPPA